MTEYMKIDSVISEELLAQYEADEEKWAADELTTVQFNEKYEYTLSLNKQEGDSNVSPG